VYDKVLGRYVNVYTDANGAQVYGYSESEYFTPSLVTNLITNGENILNPTGWHQEKDGTVPVELVPSYSSNSSSDVKRTFGLEFAFNKQSNKYLKNTGFKDSAENIK
jgi:hypothetical protein